jgi:hypothetical protein
VLGLRESRADHTIGVDHEHGDRVPVGERRHLARRELGMRWQEWTLDAVRVDLHCERRGPL